MIACNANTTRHYIPRIPSELNKKEEERTNTFKKSIQKRAPLWETAFSGVRIDIQGEERDSIRLFIP